MAKRINTKESVINLGPYVDKKIRVKFVGGREVLGILKGADPICNLVLDETVEFLIDAKTGFLTNQERELGILIARGTSVLSICDENGFGEVENPYAE